MRPLACPRGASALFMLFLAGSAAAWAQQIHRWVDERGRVHYSATRPPQALEQAVLDK